MTKRMFIVLFVVAFVGLPIALQAQPRSPRLSWGAPDLQGIWLYWTATPLERPEEFGDKAVVTPDEAAAFVALVHERVQGKISGDWDLLAGLLDGRTSLLIDPPNGKLPARTKAGQSRKDTLDPPLDRRAADGPEDRGRHERCILGRVPYLPAPFQLQLRILQTPDHVAVQEEGGSLRLIPVTNQARLPESIRLWNGSSRGHWEGNRLVVDTTNFNGKWSLAGTGSDMRLVERFTRTTAATLDYEFMVHDELSFASPWTVRFSLTRDPGPIYEYACHEGNYSMPLILSAARALERGTTK